ASSCNAVGAGCDQAYAGKANGPGAFGSSLVTMATDSTLTSGGAVSGNWTPSNPTFSFNQSTFADPTAGKIQPPLQASGAMPTCGVQGGTISGGTLGAYQYYSYNITDNTGKPIPTGDPITLSGT